MTKTLHVLTGTPGTGKSTLIVELATMGFSFVEEPARPILTRQLAIDGPDLPSKSPLRFVQAMARQMIADHESAIRTGHPTFFDRGIPDLLAYAIRFGVSPAEFIEAAKVYRYSPKVFILSPWEDIFVNDELRKLSFEESLRFHQELVLAYEGAGYELVWVPKKPVDERAAFILSELEK